MGHNLLVELEGEKMLSRWFIPSPAATTQCLLPDSIQDFLYFFQHDISRTEDCMSPILAETWGRDQNSVPSPLLNESAQLESSYHQSMIYSGALNPQQTLDNN